MTTTKHRPAVSRTTNDSAARSRDRLRAAGMAAAGMFLVGTLTGVAKLIEDYPLYGGQAVRYTVAAAVLLAAARLRGLRFMRPTRREAALLAALALTGLVLFNLCVISSARESGATLVGAVLGAVPLVLALAGERSRRTLASALVVVAGATLVTGLGSGTPAGLAWALGALACEVCFSLLALPLLPRLGAVRVSAYSTALAVPMLLVTGLALDGTAMLRMPSPAEALGLAHLSIMVTAVAFFLWYSARPRLGPGRAGLFTGLIPVGAIVTTVVLGLGTPSPADLAGTGLVVAGLLAGLGGGPVEPRERHGAHPGRDTGDGGHTLGDDRRSAP